MHLPSDAEIFRKFPLTGRPDIARTAIAWTGIVGFLLRQEFAVLYRTAFTAPEGAKFLEIGSLLPGSLANKLLSFAVSSDKARSTVFLPEQAWPCKTECP